MSNTDGEDTQIERCQYELWVNEYFGLPENFPEKATRMDFDYGNLVNMLAMFDVKRNEHHKQNLNDCMNEQDLELASLREQLKLSKEIGIERGEQLRQQEEVIRELTDLIGDMLASQEQFGTLTTNLIEKAKSLTTKP